MGLSVVLHTVFQTTLSNGLGALAETDTIPTASASTRVEIPIPTDFRMDKSDPLKEGANALNYCRSFKEDSSECLVYLGTESCSVF